MREWLFFSLASLTVGVSSLSRYPIMPLSFPLRALDVVTTLSQSGDACTLMPVVLPDHLSLLGKVLGKIVTLFIYSSSKTIWYQVLQPWNGYLTIWLHLICSILR